VLPVRLQQCPLAARKAQEGLECPVGPLGFVFQSIPEFSLLSIHNRSVADSEELRRPLRIPTTAPLSHHQTHILAEHKRCMLVILNSEPDFWGWCKLRVFAHSFLVTHPHPAIREWLYARTVSDHSHRSESLIFTAPLLVAGNKPRARE
jgi:hypothetical protein